MTLHLESLRKALDTFDLIARASSDDQRMAQLSDDERIAIRAGVVWYFEATYELCWKLMVRWMNENVTPGIADGVTRRHLFRLAAEQRLIEDVDQWMHHHQWRSPIPYTYGYDRAEAVYHAAIDFVQDARDLLQALEARND